MDWFNAVSATGTVVAMAIAIDGNIRSRRASRRERRAASLSVAIREFTSSTSPSLGPLWSLAEQQLVITNAGPGDTKSLEVAGTLANDPDDDTVRFAAWPESVYIASGSVVRVDCALLDKAGDEWEPSGVQFPIDLHMSWSDGRGRQQQTFVVTGADP